MDAMSMTAEEIKDLHTTYKDALEGIRESIQRSADALDELKIEVSHLKLYVEDFELALKDLGIIDAGKLAETHREAHE